MDERLRKILETVKSKDNAYKFSGVTPAIEDLDEKLTFISLNELNFKNDNDLFKMLELDLKLINDRMSAYMEEDLKDLVKNNPEILNVDPSRIIMCKKRSHDYAVDGVVCNYITDDALWAKVEEQLLGSSLNMPDTSDVKETDPDIWISGDMDEVVKDAISYDGVVDLNNPLVKAKMIEVEDLITNILAAIGVNAEKDGLVNPDIDKNDFIEKLIASNPNLSVADIATYYINYCYGMEAGIKELATELSENRNTLRR